MFIYEDEGTSPKGWGNFCCPYSKGEMLQGGTSPVPHGQLFHCILCYEVNDLASKH